MQQISNSMERILFSDILVAKKKIKLKKYWKDLRMSSPLTYVTDPRYNLEGTKLVILRIKNALNFRNQKQHIKELNVYKGMGRHRISTPR